MEGKKGKLRISVENEGEMLNKADKDAKWKRNKKKNENERNEEEMANKYAN